MVWCEVLIDHDMVDRGARMIDAMMTHAPKSIKIRPTTVYRGDSELLLTYGTGHLIRRPWWKQHRKSGRHCIGLDLGYWNRKSPDPLGHSMRITIDEDHPQKLIRPEPPERFDNDKIRLREDYRANGPVILVGLGIKTARALGYSALQWERSKFLQIRAQYPLSRILFRPKRSSDGSIRGVMTVAGEIESVLKGASLVVCRHSNVAVDACIAGIPVICEDGAAFALYENNPNPSRAERLEFLRSLAHWQYKPAEASLAWEFILRNLSA